MLAVEELLCELHGEDINEQGLPPGFRFHPTDEELITFYLASKVFHGSFCGVEIAEVDLNRCEPWELPDVAKMGEREWYFFSLRDRKYPTGLRTNRATGAGYWKATGKDREVYSASTGALLGMKKTLVFYRGRAPSGEKTKWVMHEYRLDGDFSYRHSCKEEWVICRIFNKKGEKKNGFLQAAGYNILEAAAAAAAAAFSPANSGSLPPLLEAGSGGSLFEQRQPENNTAVVEVQLQNASFLIENQENIDHLKSLLNPHDVSLSQTTSHVLSINGLQPSFSPTPIPIINSSSTPTPTPTTTANKNTDTNTNLHNQSPSILLKSFLAYQDCTLKEQSTISIQCKTEANLSHFQLHDPNFGCMDKIHPNHLYPNNNNPLFFEMDCRTDHHLLGFSDEGADTTPAHDLSTSIAFGRAGLQMMLDTPIRLLGESWPLVP